MVCSSTQVPLPRPRSAPHRPAAAFTLLGFAVALLVLGALAAGAARLGLRWWLDSRATAAARDLRAFAAAFQAHAHDHGDWPPPTSQFGELPAGLPPSPALANWTRPTPLGGRYAWGRDTLQRGQRYPAALLIVTVGTDRVTTDRRLLAAVDRQLDDGNLATGKFRLGFRSQPIFVLEN